MTTDFEWPWQYGFPPFFTLQPTLATREKQLEAKLSADTLREILKYMSSRGQVAWTDKQQTRCYIYWRSPEEWGKLIYDWADATGHLNTVCTFYELVQGDDTADTEFAGLDVDLLRLSLQTLEKQGKAELISFDGSDGVKFF
ncbi:hypothetical protein MTO96_000725 [Rhipicephalus appendiculatus]